jgi:hypothetical protein
MRMAKMTKAQLPDFVRDFHEEHEAPLRAWLARLA